MIVDIRNHAELCQFTGKAYRCVLKASASWCRPCKRIAPFYIDLSTKHVSIQFGDFDVDEAPDVTKFYGTESMPTFYFIKAGTVVNTLCSANPHDLERAVLMFRSN